MSGWTIYSKQGTPKYKVENLEFRDTWMGEEFVTVSIVSSTPIELQIGDYLTYRGATYTIYSLPAALKQARSSSYGEAFKYDNVKLSARSTELTDIRFLDIVLGDNNLHYTSLPTFSVYCETVDDLVDRLQANTDRNAIQWFFITPNHSRTMQRYTGAAAVTADALWHQYYDDADDLFEGNTEINISVDKISLWEGLAFIKNNFGLNFITRDRSCIIGAPGVIANHIFQYGKGNGLYQIERVADQDQQIVTKLFAYGSDKNLPLRYYATIGDDMPNNMAVNVLMLPGFPQYALNQLCRTTYYTDGTGKRHTKVQIRKTPSASYSDIMDILGEYTIGFSDNKLRPYITSGNVGTLGVKEGDIHFTEENDDNGLQEVYPSIEGMTAGDAGVSGLPADERLDEIKACDVIDDNGVFEEGAEIPNFNIYLKPLGFDLKQAYDANGGTMVIHLNDGYCGGRDFSVKSVEWEEANSRWKLNVERHHDESLDLYFPYSWGKSTGGSSSANEAYQIRTGDHFVLTEIEISDTSYIWAASVKALRKAVTWLLNNDYTRFTYLPKVDEIFMARQHDSSTPGTSLHDTLKAGDVMNFEDSDLDIAGNVFIDTLTIKENGNNGIPTYDVVLRNDKQVGTMQRIQNQLNTLSSFVTGGGGGLSIAQIRQLIQTYGAGLFLSKLNDDTAQGFLKLIKGIQVGVDYIPDILGEGGVFRMNADGKVELVTDFLYTRVKAYFDNVEIRDYQHTSGNRIASQAQGFKCSRVEWYDGNNNVLKQTIANKSNVAYFRCYWRVDDGQKKTDNQFIIGDLAFCKREEVTNGSLVTNRFWRLVIGRNEGTTTTEDGEAWVDLSNAHNANGTPKMTTITWEGQGGVEQSMQALSFEAGSGFPMAEDDICQLGDVRDATRQGAIIEYVSGIDSPTYQIYQDIGSDATNPYSLNNKNYISLGYNTATGRAYMNVYGDMYIGAKPDPQTGVSPTYIEYKQDDGTQYHRPSLKIKANVEFTNPDSELDSFVQEHQNNYDDSWIQPALDAIQEQIDGELDTWYYAGVPTLNNAPANTWTTDQLKNDHVGDLYYDKNTGYAYRFLYDDENEIYYWKQIHDDAISEALRIASEAQDTADGKRRVFICDSSHHTPTLPYDEGDLWVNVKYPWATGAKYNNEILKCIKPVPRTEGGQDITTFDIDDWSVANGYTAALKNFVDNTYAPFVTNIQGQVDGKAETWRQETNPENSWSTDTEKAKHVGDLWMDISANGGNKTYIYVDNGASASIRYAWVAQEVPDVVFDEIDGKADIFVSKPTAYNANDMWIIEEGATNLPTDCVAGDIVIADNMPSGTKKRTSYNKSDWRKKDRYTDDSSLTTFLAGYQGTAQQLKNQIDQKAETWYQSTNPANAQGWVSSEHIGDLWYNTTNQKTYYYDGTTTTDSYVGWKQQDVPIEVFNKIDGKASIFVSQPSNYKANDLWILSADTTVNGVAYKQGEVLTSSADSVTYVASHWSKKLRYTDDTYAHGFDFLTSNLARLSSTEIAGGLVLSSLIGLRDTNNLIQSGINGIIQSAKKGNGIAAWYGGEQGDWEDQSHYTGVTRWAKSLFRFDGSGYLASGNISWNEQGGVTIKGITTLYDSQDTNLLNALTEVQAMFGNSTWDSGGTTEIRIQPKQVFDHILINRTTTVPTTMPSPITGINDYSVLNYGEMKARFVPLEFFNAIFTAFSDSASTSSINPQTWTPSTVINNLKVKVGLWTQQYISALGQNAQGGGGGGGATRLDALSDVAISNPTNGQVLKYNSTTGKWYNGTDSGVTSVAWSAITGKPSTISGYGISDAYISNGTITLGSNSITPITSLSGYATQSWVNTQLGSYLKLDAGTSEQTVKSSIGTASHGVLNLWRSSGNHITFLGFSNGTTETYLGAIGFRSNSDTNLYHRTANAVYYKIWDDNNVTASMIPDLSGTYLSLSGGTMTGCIRKAGTSQAWYQGRDTSLIKTTSYSGYNALVSMKTTDGSWELGVYSSNTAYLTYITDANYNADSNTTTYQLTFPKKKDTIAVLGDIPTNYYSSTASRTANTVLAAPNGSAGAATFRALVAADIPSLAASKITSGTFAAARIPDLSGTYLPLTGGTLSGNVAISNTAGGQNICYSVTGKTYSMFFGIGSGNVNRGIYDLTGNGWLLYFNASNTILNYGDVGIGTTSPAYKLDVQGTLGVNGIATIQHYINIDRTPSGALSQGTQLNILAARSKNAGTGTYSYNAVISTFGSGETGTTVNNFPVRLGSQSGATWISAGESSKTFSGVNTGMCNTENLYLTADGSISIYTGLANDSTDYATKEALNIDTSQNVWIAGAVTLNNNKYLRAKDASGTVRNLIGISSGNAVAICTATAQAGCDTYLSGNNLYLRYGTTPTVGMILNSSGNVGIGTSEPAYKFEVSNVTDGTAAWSARIMGEQTVDSATSRASVYLAQSAGNGMFVGVSSTNDGYIASFQRGLTAAGSGGNAAMQIRADGSVCIGVWAATCSTAIGTTAKTATINGYTLVSGRVVRITFSKGNSVTAPTLNISSTGAKTIRQADNTALTSTTIAAGDVVDLQYDGTYYKIVGINQNIGEGYSLWVNSVIKATNSISVSKPTSASSTIFVENINRKISLYASTNGGIYDHKTSTWLLATNGTSTWLSQGNVGIGNTSPSYKLDVAGVIHSTTGIFSDAYVSALGQNTSSDIRKKDIKENFTLGIDEIAAAPIVRYELKDNRELGRQVGSIAQYWQRVLPESIHEDGDGYLTMQYGVIALLASISAARKIQDHEQRIKKLEKENMRLRTKVEQLKAE